MLINGHSAKGGGRIPSSLLDTYVRYKQDTRAIIAWLLSHGTRKYKSLKTVSIRDLLCLAEVVQEKAVVMPDTIDFHFREAISAREKPILCKLLPASISVFSLDKSLSCIAISFC